MTEKRLRGSSIRTGEKKGIAEAASEGSMSSEKEFKPPLIRERKGPKSKRIKKEKEGSRLSVSS